MYTSQNRIGSGSTGSVSGGSASGSSASAASGLPTHVKNVLTSSGKVDWQVVNAKYSTPARNLSASELEQQIVEVVDIYRYDMGMPAATRDSAFEAHLEDLRQQSYSEFMKDQSITDKLKRGEGINGGSTILQVQNTAFDVINNYRYGLRDMTGKNSYGLIVYDYDYDDAARNPIASKVYVLVFK